MLHKVLRNSHYIRYNIISFLCTLQYAYCTRWNVELKIVIVRVRNIKNWWKFCHTTRNKDEMSIWVQTTCTACSAGLAFSQNLISMIDFSRIFGVLSKQFWNPDIFISQLLSSGYSNPRYNYGAQFEYIHHSLSKFGHFEIFFRSIPRQ